jgi:hypothetical protein
MDATCLGDTDPVRRAIAAMGDPQMVERIAPLVLVNRTA